MTHGPDCICKDCVYEAALHALADKEAEALDQLLRDVNKWMSPFKPGYLVPDLRAEREKLFGGTI